MQYNLNLNKEILLPNFRVSLAENELTEIQLYTEIKGIDEGIFLETSKDFKFIIRSDIFSYFFLDSVGFNKQNGWTLYCPDETNLSWFNSFYAEHPKIGKVKGDLCGYIKASSKKAYEVFLKTYKPRDIELSDLC